MLISVSARAEAQINSINPCPLTGAITVTTATGALPNVAQYTCASMAAVPPFNGPDSTYGGSGQTFSFAASNPSLLAGGTALGPASLSNSIAVVVLGGQATGTFTFSGVQAFIQYGYYNNSYCATPTGSLTITALNPGAKTGAGTFQANALCDSSGTIVYSNITGSFHIP